MGGGAASQSASFLQWLYFLFLFSSKGLCAPAGKWHRKECISITSTVIVIVHYVKSTVSCNRT